jgi:hypothetical protein
MATAKYPRPTPGPGDTNTPTDVAKVNQTAAQAESEAAPAAAPESSPQSAPGAASQAPGEQVSMQPLDMGGEENHVPDSKYSNDPVLGPTTKPQEAIQTGANPGLGAGRPQVSAGTWAALNAAANDPEAPPEIHNLINLLVYHSNN